ncbi:uncharacterized protein LOC128241838 isoform X1 [Mya arenaria]|uniref:uncharacterized protein LOC128241838 isoform X1 n=1 Tax=Mya arenaria TaxID=6604 RepID=UPI0022E25072|nr:uncharacterized protein LOC128241838 isoform X1 [Mya arenaria]
MASNGRLSDGQKNQLEQWIGQGHKDFVLLFSFSIDGGQASAFHNKCNNQGPTVTVVHNEHKSVYGGYASQSWTSCDRDVTDQYAFLYQLQFSGTIKCNKFPVVNHSRALLDLKCYGPIFGSSGHDLYTFNNATKSGDFYNLDGHMNAFGNNYNVNGTKATHVNNDTKCVEELEVYKVVDCSGNCARHAVPKPMEEKPWRKTNQWSKKKLLENISSHKPISGLGVVDFRYAIFGSVGGGKSSCINTLLSAFAGRISQRASTGSGGAGITTSFTPYPLKSSSGSSANIRLYDTPGFTETSGLDLIDFNYMLEGHISDHYMEMLEDITSLKPVSGLNITDFRIAMFGQVGRGKSSCVNTLLSTFAGRISQRASTGCGRTGTITSYTPYPLKSSSGSSANIRLFDTPGFTETFGLDLIDFYHILEGHISDHFMFHPSAHITWKSEKFVQKPTMNHRIHCGVIVIDASTVDAFTDENTSKLKALKSLMDEKRILCVVLLTKIDKVAPELEDNWKTTFKDPKVKECVDKAATGIGISRNNVHPVKNYEIEVEVDEDLNVLSLLALRQIIHLSMDHMENGKLREDGNAVSESAEAVGPDTA